MGRTEVNLALPRLAVLLVTVLLTTCLNPLIDLVKRPRIVLRQAADALPTGQTFDFGSVSVGSFEEAEFTIRNTGTTVLSLTGTPLVALSGPSTFELLSDPAPSVAPGAAVSFTVRFTPLDASLQTGTASIESNDPDNGTYTVGLSGQGVFTTPYTLDLQTGAGGTITNPAEASVSVIGGVPFAISASPSSGYFFAGWTLISGSGVSFEDPTSASTTVTLTTADATIRAGFAYSFLYLGSVEYADADHLSAYSIDCETGALRQVSGSTVASGAYPLSAVSHPLANFIYCANANGDSVSAYSIDGSTGKPSLVGDYSTGIHPVEIAIDAAGKFLYAANFIGDSVSAFTINSGTGALTAVSGSPFVTGDEVRGVAVTPDGKFLYAAYKSNVAGYSINATTGALTAIAGSPFANPAGSASPYIAVSPSGGFLVTANVNSPGSASVFSINATTGALTAVAGSPFTTSGYPTWPSFEPQGKFVFFNHWNSNAVSSFSINATTGALTSIGSYSTGGTSASGIAIDPTGQFLVASNFASSSAAVFSINGTTGQLSVVSGSPFSTITGVNGCLTAMHPQ